MLLVHYFTPIRYFSELDKFRAMSNGIVRPGNPPAMKHGFSILTGSPLPLEISKPLPPPFVLFFCFSSLESALILLLRYLFDSVSKSDYI